MALFSRKPKTTKAPVVKAEKAGVTTYATKYSLGTIIVSPRITEKATFVAGKHNAYLFNVNQGATKPLITKAVREIYGVTPVRVTTARTPAKRVVVRGKAGKKQAVKKAYVYLKEGDKIEFA
ncbi:MAG TPA: 50S ribosomal protein L23 [Candidatus Paceibacterota bacterium]|nr:50S ribosomal protein L23 [Candidatus Paceibacterota bacterium]